MARQLPRFDLDFSRSNAVALSFTVRIEQARILGRAWHRGQLTIADLELSYELAFLRMFIGWEGLLENSLRRLICGYSHSGGQEPVAPGKNYFATLAAAEAAILNGRRYTLWHDPGQVMKRAKQFLDNSRYEIVIASAQTRIEQYAIIRHRIAHSQQDALQRFDVATMSLTGRRYRGARPGRFLRDWTVVGGNRVRWLEAAATELEGIAHQICS